MPARYRVEAALAAVITMTGVLLWFRAPAFFSSANLLGVLLASLPVGDNRGLLRPWLAGDVRVAQKNAWISDLRTTAAIVYAPTGPTIVVVEASRPGITSVEARTLGRQVLRAIRL